MASHLVSVDEQQHGDEQLTQDQRDQQTQVLGTGSSDVIIVAAAALSAGVTHHHQEQHLLAASAHEAHDANHKHQPANQQKPRPHDADFIWRRGQKNVSLAAASSELTALMLTGNLFKLINLLACSLSL